MTHTLEIDATDVKLLKVLQVNPRTTFSKLADLCETSIFNVRARYDGLCKEGVIVGAVMGFHPKIRGFENFVWLGIITQMGKQKDVIIFLNECPNIMGIYVEVGKYNIRCSLALKNINELGTLVDSFKKNKNIIEIESMIWTNIEEMAHPTNLVIRPFSESKDDEKYQYFEDIGKEQVIIKKQEEKKDHQKCINHFKNDSINKTIIKKLSQNARISFRSIAQELGVSTKTIILRYKKLKRNCVWYSTLSLDFEKLGYSGHISSLIKVSNEAWISEVINKLSQIPNAIAIMRLIGPYDIDVLMPFSDASDLMKITELFSKISGIEHISYQIGKSLIWPPMPNNLIR